MSLHFLLESFEVDIRSHGTYKKCMLEDILNIGRKLDLNVNTIESFLNSKAQRFMCIYTVPK